ncbi:MAG TPA: hypothetical protein VN610_08190 [Bryobacteraceae bacterium]|nr:hypothetical protein [Bryobacteraceae bacterium]
MSAISRSTWRQALAITGAQWRIARNRLPRANVFGLIFTGFIGLLWYGSFTVLAILAAIFLSDPQALAMASKALPAALFFAFLFWQVLPILMTSAGFSLDLKRLRAFPIPEEALFWIESLLRLSTGAEVVLVLAGASVGLWRNPLVPWWGPLWFLPYIAFNLFLAVGIRDLAARLLLRKGFREAFILLIVLCTALPSLLSSRHGASGFGRLLDVLPRGFSPWAEAGRLALGHGAVIAAVVMLLWAAAAYAFGWWQFRVSFREEEMPVETSGKRAGRRIEGFYSLIGAWLPDPIAALVEKEIRMLSRYSAFRVVFLMGFTFGILIWFPMAFGNNRHGFLAENYPSFASTYALLLLSDILFWNAFGRERGAIQNYFLAPVQAAAVLIAKNLTALFFVLLEVTAIVAVSSVFRLAGSLRLFLEAYAITIVMTLYMASLGNLTSVHFPRAVNLKKTFGNAGAGRRQFVMFGSFALVCAPLSLAFLARWALDSEAAFFAVLFLVTAAGAALYWVSLDSAATALARRAEPMITILSAREGMISS